MGSTVGNEGLKEFYHVHQNEPGIRRRWFSDSSYELILWYDEPDQKLTGFQICYGPENSENAITWADGHFSHRSIVDEVNSRATPILNGAVSLPDNSLVRDFLQHASGLEPEIYDYVRDVLERKLG